MLVSDVLREQYTKLDAAATLPEICRIFAQKRVSSAPVHKNEQFIGVVSDADIVAFIAKSKLGNVWEKDKPTPVAALAGITAQMLARKPKLVLAPSDRLSAVLPRIVRRDIDLVPVVDDGRLVGLVRGADIIGVLLREFAKGEISQAAPAEAPASAPAGAVREGVGSDSVDTFVDQLVLIIKHKKSVSVGELSKETRLPRQQLEKIARSLEAHGIIIMEYPLLGDVILKVRPHE